MFLLPNKKIIGGVVEKEDVEFLRKTRRSACSTSNWFLIAAIGSGIGREVAAYVGEYDWNISLCIPLLAALLAIYYKIEHIFIDSKLSKVLK